MHAQRHQVVHDIVLAGHRREHRADAPGLVAPGYLFESEIDLSIGVVHGALKMLGAIVADWHGNPMVWGERKRPGNVRSSCLDSSSPPRPFTLGQSTFVCGKTISERPYSSCGLIRARRLENLVSNTRQYRRHSNAARFQQSSERRRSPKATAPSLPWC